MKTPELSFVSYAEQLTVIAHKNSGITGRLAAVLLSPAAALDIALHSLLVIPTCTYAIGKSLYQKQMDFTLPWQHLQRIRNAVSPLLLGSAFGVVHPFAGIAMSEATDKHAVIGMLTSNTKLNLETPCSPIHSSAIVEDIAKNHRFAESNGVKKEIFSKEHVKVLNDVKNLEKSLEALQAQEYIHKITNLTLFVMAGIKSKIDNSFLCDFGKAILVRASGVLIPVLTAVDLAITLLAQAFFLTTGVVRAISGRGPIYTEVTTNPLMHASLLIQNILKSVGNLVGTFVWFVSPMTGFKVSLLPATSFFKLQMNMLMSQIKEKMESSGNKEKFAIPIVFGNGACSVLSVPTHSMHTTYLIVEKDNDSFNLYWVNRPNITCKKGLSSDETSSQIRSMLDERFPFMNIEKLMNYPVRSNKPEFSKSTESEKIAEQGSPTNCVVANMFGMLEALDTIQGKEKDITELRYKHVRSVLMKDYDFYKNDFTPFGFSLTSIWKTFEKYPKASI